MQTGDPMKNKTIPSLLSALLLLSLLAGCGAEAETGDVLNDAVFSRALAV